MKKYKLRCFRYPNKTFKNKDEVWRDARGYPVCKEHAEEDIWDEWDDSNIDYLMDTIEKRHNRSIKKFNKYVDNGMEACSICDRMFEWDELTDWEDKLYCPGCFDNV